MRAQLPNGARKELDAILDKLRKCINNGAKEQTAARSHFMKYGDAVGGPMLQCNPAIAHPEQELLAMYQSLFDSSAADGLELREIETRFERLGGTGWSHESRWVTVAEYDEFSEAVKPIIEELRQTLRQTAARESADWNRATFDTDGPKPRRVLIRPADSSRITLEPTAELVALVGRISNGADERGLRFKGGTWRVSREMDDVEGEIDSTVGVI